MSIRSTITLVAGRVIIRRVLRPLFRWCYEQTFHMERNLIMSETCKHENANGKKFCPDCGKKVDTSADEFTNNLLDEFEKRFDVKRRKSAGDNQPDDNDDQPANELERMIGKRKKGKK